MSVSGAMPVGEPEKGEVVQPEVERQGCAKQQHLIPASIRC